VPACSSSLISAVVGDLASLPAADRAALAERIPQLVAYLAWVPDPRDPRGVRHTLTSLLATAVAAALSGATSFAAIGEWIADVPAEVMAALGIRCDPLARRYEPPDEATIREVVERLDATAFTAATGGWLKSLADLRDGTERQAGRRAAVPATLRPRREQVVVDGKALRGTRHHTASGRARHLLAACTGRHGLVLAQVEVDGKTNELSAFAPLLEPLDLAGTVVTADALHTQRDHAVFLVEDKQAHYILAVKNNQPSLYRQLKRLPWRQVKIAHSEDHHGHGRTERRSIKVVSVGEGLLFPHAAQAIQITRKTRPRNGGRWKIVTSTPSPASPHTRPGPKSSPPGSAGTGRSKHSTTSATSPTKKTHPRSAPGPARPSWPPSATSPSGS
jgi:predicted transposase YbfD/YdcC